MKYNLILVAFLASGKKMSLKDESLDLKDYQDESDYICDGDGVQNQVSDVGIAEYSELQKDIAEGNQVPQQENQLSEKPKNKTMSVVQNKK
jgi:hypothetical protein